MKKLFLLTLLFAAFLIAWNGKDCDHIYVAVEQQEVKANQSITYSSVFIEQTITGKHEGKELVCVKCFNRINQVLDYGSAKLRQYNYNFIQLPYSDTLQFSEWNRIIIDTNIQKVIIRGAIDIENNK